MNTKNEQASFFQAFENQEFGYDLPKKFTFPFYYEPHPIALEAVKNLQSYLENQTDFEHNFGLIEGQEGLVIGKMFGVLVVRDQNGTLGYLSAVSGKLADSNEHKVFVPPVFDILAKDSFFLKGEEEISAINEEIDRLENNPQLSDLQTALQNIENERDSSLQKIKAEIKIEKKKRDEIRKNLPKEDAEKIIESLRLQSIREQYFLKDQVNDFKVKIENASKKLFEFESKIENLKEKRRTKSNALQQRIFDRYSFLNQVKEWKSLASIFADTADHKPPAGAGECAAPKLLHYAFLNDLEPIALAEFWWGASPVSEIRTHKQFYPACKSKCEPILKHMLEGIELDDNPMLEEIVLDKEIEILYEDDQIVAINKPAELLSVPGKLIFHSVYSIMKKKYPDASGPLIVHRLDQSTSGIMLLTKDEKTYKYLQRQFIKRKIEKRYSAVLEGVVEQKSGTISLPLRVDLDDRPRQLVCYEHGKEAVTFYEVNKIENERTFIHYFPKTGRTHQLRVHSAHILGLNSPIVGDDLYGSKADRLHLHADYIKFLHPVTRAFVEISCQVPF